MSQIDLNDVTSGYNLVKINNNFQEIERVINEELLHRVNADNIPNSLQTDIDANSHHIYNLPKPQSGGEPLRVKDLFGDPDDLLGGPTLEHVTAVAGQTVVPLTTSYVVGSDSLYVFHNGEFLVKDVDYIETSTTSITIINRTVLDGDIISFVPAVVVTGGGGGGGGGPPTGPAGGVLSGTYPNPSFAQDVVLGQELFIGLANKSDHLHEHYLGALTRSGATVGQVPVWDGEKWAPATVTGGGGVGGTPTGPAGGDLAGTYPNPTLSAAKNAEIAGKAPSSHTHALNTITVPGGSTAGHVATWNGSEMALAAPTGGGGGSAKTRIAFVGDSLTARQALLSPAVPDLVESYLNASGAEVEVANLAKNGWNFFRANTVAVFGTQTMRDKLISMTPAIIHVHFGFNDALTNNDGRSLAQIQGDALAFFQAVRTALPSCKIFYGSQLSHDSTHSAPASLLNRHVTPAFFQLKSSGILANSYCSEMLGDACSSGVRTAYSNWVALDTYIKGLSQVDASYTVPIWKAARLGLVGYDTVHLTETGTVFCAAAVRTAYKDVPAMASALPNLSNQDYDSFNNPDNLFSLTFTDNGSEWIETSPSPTRDHPVNQFGPWRSINPPAWHMPSKGNFNCNDTTYVKDSGNSFTWMLQGVRPGTTIEVSQNGGAFSSIGRSTDGRGNYIAAGQLNMLSAGTYAFRYRIGNEIHGPLSVTVTDGGGGGTSKAYGSIKGLTSQTSKSTANVFTTVPFNLSGATLVNGITTQLNGLVVPRSGRYRISACCMVTRDATTACNLAVAVFANGARVLDGTTAYNAGPVSTAITLTINGVVQLSAGAGIDVQIFNTLVNTMKDNAEVTTNYLQIEEL